MPHNIIPISFALTPRMQSFIEMRDALHCLDQAIQADAPYAWLPAVKDVHDMLVGEGNKKPAIPNILSLFNSVRKHFQILAKKHPEFQEKLMQAADGISLQADIIRQQIPEIVEFLSSDGWLSAYSDTIRNQDLLGHRLSLPQLITPLWHGHGQHGERLQLILKPVMRAIVHLNQMLHAHVPWEQRVAQKGYDQITLHAQDDIGLIIIGLSSETIAQGILPSCSGFRSTVRLRFTQWEPGKPAHDLEHDQNYALMAVPVL